VTMGPTYYAIGDIHGMMGKLETLYGAIKDDVAARGGRAVIVHLGDYVDRGSDSRGVLERVIGLSRSPPAFCDAVVCLKGNHEQMMLDAIDAETDADPAVGQWFHNGGREAVASYSRGAGEAWREWIEPGHIAWIRALPHIHVDAGRRLVFVHAGIDPTTFPEQGEEISLWTRSGKFFETERWPERPELVGITVIHGHTPTQDFRPFFGPRRINVDTGAVYGGPLTCAVIAPEEPPRALSVR
jgi:serine/threonine protein phosphatase 1